MSTELEGFNAEDYEPAGKFTPIPVGDYLSMITESEMKDTKPKPNKESGKYLHLVFTICDGEFTGRKIFSQLNLVNANTTTVEIAQRQLSAICRCVGVLHPKDSKELHDKPLVISVGIRPAKDGYEESNVIKGFSREDGKELKDIVSDTPAAKSEAPSGSPAKVKKPWEKK
jgi:hypothetical protein